MKGCRTPRDTMMASMQPLSRAARTQRRSRSLMGDAAERIATALERIAAALEAGES